MGIKEVKVQGRPLCLFYFYVPAYPRHRLIIRWWVRYSVDVESDRLTIHADAPHWLMQFYIKYYPKLDIAK